MPNRAKQKGDRGERAVVGLLNSISGITAQRIPLSGAAGGEFKGDIKIMPSDKRRRPMTGEVKVRGNGFTALYDWLAKNDFLFIKADYQNPLVVMDFEHFSGLMEQSYGSTKGENYFVRPVDDGSREGRY